ncbi:MAG: RIP metalloprotease RseP [Omnitrophica WOR_2 bacterium RIFCSPHIGHO2_02_FULL_52_10]|nr:MAG: RIP metalloprotease RseP [Omnitrophica WOR_2 bacterium RIFCSPHIGHO2_02_FULL_52_10]
MIGSIVANLQNIFVFVVFLSVLIIVHEWGHFITAKRLGIEVQRFALGFGPTIFSKVYEGTRYMINAIPLGGYVKMAGDERAEYQGKPGEFLSKPAGHRALVVLNGPVVNFILAYLSFVIVFMIGYPGHSTTITKINEGGPAAAAGLRVGDKIIGVDARKIYGLLNLDARLEGDRAAPATVTVVRKGEVIGFTVNPEIVDKPNLVGRLRKVRDFGIDTFPIDENLANVIGGLEPAFPAKKAGLVAGDRIVEIDGKKITDWQSLQSAVETSAGEQIRIKIIRDGQELIKSVTPKIVTAQNESGQNMQVRRIGISPKQEITLDLFRFGFIDSLVFAGEELWFITGLTYEALYRLVIGAAKAEESVAGPIGIFYIVKGAAESGISHLLFVLGVISASLAIFNLLPVIPLDGGHLFLLGIEKVRGRALSPKADEYVARVGFSLIILLALFIFYVDFVRWGWFDYIGNLFG